MRKPLQINELEKHFGISFLQAEKWGDKFHHSILEPFEYEHHDWGDTLIRFGRERATYMLNKADEIIGLDLEGCNIDEIAVLESFHNLETLRLSNNKIQNLSPIKALSNLRELNLADNKIQDFTPLEFLSKLRKVNLKANQIHDITSLGRLYNIQELNLSNNHIRDVTPLAALHNLRSLDLTNNQIRDVAPLGALHNLSSLDLTNNRIRNIAPLGTLYNLENLYLTSNQIQNITSLDKIQSLRVLNLTNNKIEDITPFAVVFKLLKNLQSLILKQNQIQDISSLVMLNNLQVLNLDGNRIQEIALENFENLKSITMMENPIIGITLRNLKNIEELTLNRLGIERVVLENLSNLKSLDLRNNKIKDVYIEKLPNLINFYLSGNPLSKIRFIDVSSIKQLDLRSLKIERIELKGVKRLKELNLSNNAISDVSFLQDMKNLSNLDLGNNQILDASFLQHLHGLTNLELGNNRISDISFLKGLKYLISLGLRKNNISDISLLKYTPGLTDLDIDLNPIHNYSSLRYLTLLEILKIKDNIQDVTCLQNARYLKEIYLSGSSDKHEIVDYLSNKSLFPALNTIGYKLPVISILEKQVDCQLQPVYPGRVTDMIDNQTYTINNKAELTAFRLRRKYLQNISFLKDFAKLEILDLRINSITEISVIQGLTELRELHLYGNNISHIPVDFFDSLPKLEYINLRGNPIENIPKEIFDKDENVLMAVKTYLNSLQGERGYLHQAKMILVGNGEVGKTSIRVKLINKNASLPKKEERTQGLDISTFRIHNLAPNITKLDKNIDFDLFIWDFGGQGKYREVQQLFCGRKALYLFVTSVDDNVEKEDYIGFAYWLSMAKSYGYDQKENWQSPILHIVNKCDLGRKPVNEDDLLKSFDNIFDFIKISCKEPLQNFDKLEDSIRRALPKVSKDIFTNQFSKKWFDVKKALEENKKKNHIELFEYREICQIKDLNEAEGNMWLDYLDRIGSLIYFRENPDLNNFIVLNPLWVKDSMYKVLDSEFVEDGILKEKFLPYIWNEYRPYEHSKLLYIMLAYKICYLQTNSQGKTEYVIPALFPETKPKIPDNLMIYNYELRFDYSPFIPAGTVNKLMVELNSYIYQELRWKNGCILHIMDGQYISYAEVTEDWENKCVFVKIGGYDLYAIYNLIRSTLLQLLQELKKTKLLDILELETKIKIDGDYESPKTIVKFGRDNEFGFLFGKGNHIIHQNNNETLQITKKSEYLPVILTVFANPKDDLNCLKEEQNGIQNALMPLEKDNKIKHLIRSYTDLDSYFNFLRQWKNQISIFHYGGHADAERFALQDMHAFFEPLAKELTDRNKNSLILVFLNGCSTYAHVKTLFDLGVRAVIATSINTDDSIAAKFAIRFYENLANDDDLLGAYKSAAGYIISEDRRTKGADENIKGESLERRFRLLGDVVRSIGFSDEEAYNESGDFPWGLYINGDDSDLTRKFFS